MGLQGPFKVECDDLFPIGIGLVSAVSPMRDYNRSTPEHPVQEIDEDTGDPVWVADVMDFDPDARERTFRVRIVAKVQPVPPDAVKGAPVRPVHLDGLTIKPYPKEAGRDRKTGQVRYTQGYTLRATGLSEPRYGESSSSSSSSAAGSSSAGSSKA